MNKKFYFPPTLLFKGLWISILICILLGLGWVLFAEISTTLLSGSFIITHGASTGSYILSLTSDNGIEPYTYLFATGVGSEDNDKFFISGNSLYTNFSPDYNIPMDSGDTPGNNTYSVHIQTMDSANISSGEVFSYGYALNATDPAGFYNHGFYPNQGAFAFLREDKSILAIGSASYGGSGAPTGTGFVKIISSSSAFATLKDDGTIKIRGNININPTETGFVDIIGGPSTFVAIKDNGSLKAWGNYATVPADTGFIHIFSNGGAFAALKDDGSIKVWGNSTWGGSGAPTGTGYVSIFSSQQGFVALKDDGSLIKRGSISGTPPTGTGYSGVASTLYAFAEFNPDGTLSARGYGANNGDGIPTGTGFIKIYTNFSAFAALKDDGSIKVRGIYGGSGGPTGTGYISVSAAQQAFAALKDDGSIFARGSATLGGSGAPADTGYREISSTDRAFAALKDDGSLFVRGDANRGGANAPSGTGFIKIYGGRSAFIALKDDGTLISRGDTAGGGNRTSSIHNISFQNFLFTVTLDNDNDGIENNDDNCPFVYNPGQEDSYYTYQSGESIYFQVLDGDFSFDTLSDNIYISRFPGEVGIFNVLFEGSYSLESPLYTLRAVGSCQNKDTLSFDYLGSALETAGYSIYSGNFTGVELCMNDTISGTYYTITFSEWTPYEMGNNGFAYTRTQILSDSVGDACDCSDLICTTGNDINGNLICSPADPICPVSNNNTNGGGNTLSKDNCPNGDLSPSYYDETCGSGSITITMTGDSHGSAITTGEALGTNKRLTRKDIAIVMTLFATEKLGITTGDQKYCRYTDIRGLSTGQQLTIQKGCQLGLIGLNQDGITPLQKFRPYDYITKNEFITVLSRLLYDGKYNIPLTETKERYTFHIQALQKASLIPEIPNAITTSFVVSLLQLIKDTPSLIQRK